MVKTMVSWKMRSYLGHLLIGFEVSLIRQGKWDTAMARRCRQALVSSAEMGRWKGKTRGKHMENLGKIQKDDLVVSYIELNNHGPWLINVNNKPAMVRDDSPTHHLWWGQMKWPNSEFCARGLNFQHHVPIMVCHFRLTRKSSRKTIAKWAFLQFFMKLLPRKYTKIIPNWRILQPPNPAPKKRQAPPKLPKHSGGPLKVVTLLLQRAGQGKMWCPNVPIHRKGFQMKFDLGAS